MRRHFPSPYTNGHFSMIAGLLLILAIALKGENSRKRPRITLYDFRYKAETRLFGNTKSHNNQ